MEQNDRSPIGPSLGDIDRGIQSGTPKRVLYQELSQIADESRDDNSVVGKVVKKGLQKEADRIHDSKK